MHRELAAEGFQHCYSSLVKEVRRLELRPICPSCKHCRDKAPTIKIDHPPGEEIQWDWLELEETPWAADTAFNSGYTGIEGSGNLTRLTSFRSGPLPPF